MKVGGSIMKMDWFTGMEPAGTINYKKQLLLNDNEIAQITSRHMARYDELKRQFLSKSSLTKLDLSILLFTAALQCLRWAIITNDSGRFSQASDADREVAKLGEYLPADVETLLSDHTVPYDAVVQSERFKSIYPEFSTGVAGTNHRYTTLGHDPLAGWIFGTANIATNTLSVNKMSELFPSYHIRNQQFYAKTTLPQIMTWSANLLTDKPEVLGVSFLKQAVHYGTDVFTKQGLPIPVINTVSPEVSAFLIGNRIDLYSVTRGIALTMLINKLVEMFHRLFFNPSQDDKRLYEIRTRKTIMYSNTLSSLINAGYVGVTGNLKRLDVGGMLVTLWRILTDERAIRRLEIEFIEKTLDGELQKEEDEINQRLANYGFRI